MCTTTPATMADEKPKKTAKKLGLFRWSKWLKRDKKENDKIDHSEVFEKVKQTPKMPQVDMIIADLKGLELEKKKNHEARVQEDEEDDFSENFTIVTVDRTDSQSSQDSGIEKDNELDVFERKRIANIEDEKENNEANQNSAFAQCENTDDVVPQDIGCQKTKTKADESAAESTENDEEVKNDEKTKEINKNNADTGNTKKENNLGSDVIERLESLKIEQETKEETKKKKRQTVLVARAPIQPDRQAKYGVIAPYKNPRTSVTSLVNRPALCGGHIIDNTNPTTSQLSVGSTNYIEHNISAANDIYAVQTNEVENPVEIELEMITEYINEQDLKKIEEELLKSMMDGVIKGDDSLVNQIASPESKVARNQTAENPVPENTHMSPDSWEIDRLYPEFSIETSDNHHKSMQLCSPPNVTEEIFVPFDDSLLIPRPSGGFANANMLETFPPGLVTWVENNNVKYQETKQVDNTSLTDLHIEQNSPLESTSSETSLQNDYIEPYDDSLGNFRITGSDGLERFFPTPPHDKPESPYSNTYSPHTVYPPLSPAVWSPINNYEEFQKITVNDNLPLTVKGNSKQRNTTPTKTLKQFKDMQKDVAKSFSNKECCQTDRKSCKEIFQERFNRLTNEERQCLQLKVATLEPRSAYGVLKHVLHALSSPLAESEDVQYALFALLCDMLLAKVSYIFVGRVGLALLTAAVKHCAHRPELTRYLVACVRAASANNPDTCNGGDSVFAQESVEERLVCWCARAGDQHAAALAELVSKRDGDIALFNLEQTDHEGRTALHIACKEHSAESPKLHIVHVLLQHGGMDLYKWDVNGGETALHLAVNSPNCDLSLVLLLFTPLDRKEWYRLALAKNRGDLSAVRYARSAAERLRQGNSMTNQVAEVRDFLDKLRAPTKKKTSECVQ